MEVEVFGSSRDSSFSIESPLYQTSSHNYQSRPLTFRVSFNTWNGRYSTRNDIGVSSDGWSDSHAELTSRIINDGEAFTIIGEKLQVGVGLCVDSCELESKFGIRL